MVSIKLSSQSRYLSDNVTQGRRLLSYKVVGSASTAKRYSEVPFETTVVRLFARYLVEGLNVPCQITTSVFRKLLSYKVAYKVVTVELLRERYFFGYYNVIRYPLGRFIR